MKKPSAFLFTLRLFFYLSVAALVLFHPGIVVSYDRTGLVQWFFVVPLGALIAFLPAPRGKLRFKLSLALVPLCILSVWAGGLSSAALPIFLAGAISFVLTLLLFRYPRWGKLSALEPFFLAWVCFRLLVFSRSGEDAAGESMGLTQFILVWTGLVFLFHSALVYFCLYPASSGGAKKEGFVFGLAAAAALAAVIFILPADFIRNTMIINLLTGQIDRMTKLSDNEWGIPDNGGGRRRGRVTIPGSEDGQTPNLRGLSEYDWPGEGRRNRRGGDGEQRQQYAVMVVASKQEPVYMGNAIRGRLDPVGGFLYSQDEALNRLSSQRFFVTWFDSEPVYDMGRRQWDVFSLSTLPQKFFPYRPFAIEPTVQSENSGPFRYIHRVVSNVHNDDPLNLIRRPVRELSSLEKIDLAPYLEFPLERADAGVFESHLENVLEAWRARREETMGEARNEYMEKIAAILLGFSGYQYNVNDNNTASVSDMINFLTNTKEGDCVEFSNTAALLGRLAGIPSRVVTGYMAAEGLQTIAHLRGLAALRSRIPVLREFPFEELFLVTDAHGHSWPQFYIPGYGWVDFEATRFAIPPIGFGDGNMRDVVIPLLDENQLFSPVRSFPWRAVLRVLAFLATAALLAAYAIRYGREAALSLGASRGGRQGARSLYLLLLARLAADGKPIKPASKTAPEYARLFPEDGSFTAFAAVYTELRWRNFSDKAEEDARFRTLMEEYRNILAANRRNGPGASIIRIFSLRGLAYL
jgi:transglutaminase-like putative cysteine protease